MSKPLRPDEVTANKANVIPAEVIDTINEMITEKFVSRNLSFTIKQKDIVKRTMLKMDPDAEWQNDWLNFEGLFESYGWKVNYDKPGYNESYDASFEFTGKP